MSNPVKKTLDWVNGILRYFKHEPEALIGLAFIVGLVALVAAMIHSDLAIADECEALCKADGQAYHVRVGGKEDDENIKRFVVCRSDDNKFSLKVVYNDEEK